MQIDEVVNFASKFNTEICRFVFTDKIEEIFN